MSIEIIETKFEIDFNNFIVNDFVIDTEDVNHLFSNNDISKFTLKKPTLLISIIELNEGKYKKLVSSFTILENKINEKSEWKLIKKIDIDLCNLLILDENTNTKGLDDWLEKCILSKDLYDMLDNNFVINYNIFLSLMTYDLSRKYFCSNI